MPPLEKSEMYHTVLPTELVQLRARPSIMSQMQFTFFPVGNDPNLPRIASLATYPDSPVWKTNNADEAYHVLQDFFPQVNMRALVNPKEMAAFAANKPSHFPCIQRSESMAGWCGENVGVVLLGDAMKCFPPDLAQGLNSSLEDVAVFVEAVANATSVKEAVQLYEERRNGDISALMRLMQVGFPYQYRQNVPMYNLSMANIVFRSALAYVAPRVFNPPAIVLVSTSQYEEAIQKADETTSRILAISFASAVLSLGILMARK